ncbi:MAG: hypothetical protein Kow00100_25040 [Geothermobacteraceae bacterium]
MDEERQTWCRSLKRELSFRFLSEEQTNLLAPMLECRRLVPGEKLWDMGRICQGVGFIVNGRLDVRKPTNIPEKSVLLARLGPGSFVGEFCLLGEAEPPVEVAAPEGADLLFLSSESFVRLKKEAPEVAVQLLQGMLLTVSKRLGQAYDRIAVLF